MKKLFLQAFLKINELNLKTITPCMMFFTTKGNFFFYWSDVVNFEDGDVDYLFSFNIREVENINYKFHYKYSKVFDVDNINFEIILKDNITLKLEKLTYLTTGFLLESLKHKDNFQTFFENEDFFNNKYDKNLRIELDKLKQNNKIDDYNYQFALNIMGMTLINRIEEANKENGFL